MSCSRNETQGRQSRWAPKSSHHRLQRGGGQPRPAPPAGLGRGLGLRHHPRGRTLDQRRDLIHSSPRSPRGVRAAMPGVGLCVGGLSVCWRRVVYVSACWPRGLRCTHIGFDSSHRRRQLDNRPWFWPLARLLLCLHPPLPSAGVSIVMERERQQNDRTLVNDIPGSGAGSGAAGSG